MRTRRTPLNYNIKEVVIHHWGLLSCPSLATLNVPTHSHSWLTGSGFRAIGWPRQAMGSNLIQSCCKEFQYLHLRDRVSSSCLNTDTAQVEGMMRITLSSGRFGLLS